MSSETAGAILTIDLAALANNYTLLRDRLADTVECSAVVKANGYGLGIEAVAPALSAAGCRTFFVAQLGEAIRLRALLAQPDIFVLNGLAPGQESDFAAHRIFPALNSLAQIDAWSRFCRSGATPGDRAGAVVHLDTGMSRLGLPTDEFQELADNPGHLAGIDVRYVISHLACADEPDHPLNIEQRATFERLTAALPALPRGLANSSGIFLGSEYHYDLARPGVALYGGNPTPGRLNPMAEVIRLQGRIVQVREIDSPVTVGYGATHRAPGPMRIATVPVGYADGYLRCLGNRASGYIGHHRVPVVGRVSMDLITLDVTGVPPRECQPGCLVDLIGGRVSIDQVAEWADTISYEIMTSLGSRYHRVYRNGDA